MLVIRINGRKVDIDEKTAIGLTIATYDVSKPATPLISVSNSFSIPKTSNNLAAIGFAGSSYYFSTMPYDPLDVVIYHNSDILLYGAKARVEAINDRIELFIYQKYSAFEQIKLDKIIDKANDLLNFVQANTATNKYTGTLAGFLSKYSDANSGIVIPYTFSSLYPATETVGTQVYKKSGEEIYGAHCFIYLADILRYIENEYGIDFSSDENFLGNIFQDDYFRSAIVFLPFLIIRNDGGYYFEVQDENHQIAENKEAGKDLTFYNVFDAAVKLFNVLIEQEFSVSDNKYKLYRYDSLLDNAPIIDWSDRIQSISEFRPIIENVKQQNIVKYKSMPEGFPETYAGKTIECKNKNIDAKGTIIEIPAYAFGFVNDSGVLIPNLSTGEANKDCVIAILSSAQLSILAKHDTSEVNVSLYIPVLYDLSAEYQILETIYEYPQVWKIEKWLTTNDVVNFRNYACYYVDLLGACYLVTKIENYSLTANTPTKITLVKVSDKTIAKPAENYYWTDGVGNIFSDGTLTGFTFKAPNQN